MKVFPHIQHPPLDAEWRTWQAWYPVWLYREARWVNAWPWRRVFLEYWTDDTFWEKHPGWACEVGISPLVYYRHPHKGRE